MSQPLALVQSRWSALLALLLSALLFAAPLRAAVDDTQAETLVQTLTHTIIDTLKQESPTIKERPERLYELVDELLIPHVDMQVMARWVLGNYWRGATPEQQQGFTEEFRILLTRFYVSALIDDPEQLDELLANAEKMIAFKPVKLDGRKAQANAEITLSSGTVIPVTFSIYDNSGHWMLYDVTVDGISLVVNYRTSFASTLASDGLDALLKQMRERNQQMIAEGEPKKG